MHTFGETLAYVGFWMLVSGALTLLATGQVWAALVTGGLAYSTYHLYTVLDR